MMMYHTIANTDTAVPVLRLMRGPSPFHLVRFFVPSASASVPFIHTIQYSNYSSHVFFPSPRVTFSFSLHMGRGHLDVLFHASLCYCNPRRRPSRCCDTA